jgi:hypothetical protein
MIIQVANIGAGFILAAPKFKQYVGRREIERFERVIAPYLNQVGLVELGVGVVALLTRLGISNFHINYFGASFPQAIPAIVMGAVIATRYFSQYPKIGTYIKLVEKYRIELGFLGIAAGLVSIFYGCPFPLVCGQLFH